MELFEFGTAPKAKALGYQMICTLHSTAEELNQKHFDKDIVFVYGASVQGQPGVFEFAQFERIQSECISPDDQERFWTVVAPYFGLDTSFNYDANPSIIKCYLADYDSKANSLLPVDAASEALIGLLAVSGALDSENIQRAAYELRLAVAHAMGDEPRAAVARDTLAALSDLDE